MTRERTVDTPSVSEELMQAVARFDADAVRECLRRGADPNYVTAPTGTEANDDDQPTTPLRLVMFRISDTDLTDHDLTRYGEIARLLLRYGADPGPAMQIAESRYGPYDPSRGEAGPFMEVWNIVAGALERGTNRRRMYCHGCWEALDARNDRCGQCGLSFDRRNSWTYYTGRPTWQSAFSVPGHLIWPALIVLGIRVFGGPLPWPWWATFIGLAAFSGTSQFRVVFPEREGRKRRLGALHRAFVVVLIALIVFVTTFS